MSYNQTLDYLYRLQWHGIHPGLERMKLLLSLFDHPEQKFRSVHIGGTNGKGSTAAMIASILQQGRYRVGLYTSPHLIDFSERIRISGETIPQGEMIRLTQRLREKIEAESSIFQEEITFFEFTTALAFLYFAEKGVDLAVVEVGLGGRFDATNVITPLVSAITNIEFDHERYLGATLMEIAAEKAGIIKEKTPIVTAASQPEVLQSFEETARKKSAPLISIGREIKLSGDRPEAFVYEGARKRLVHCPLLGKHQIENAAVALGVIEELQKKGIALSEEAISEGIAQVKWEGRLETARRDPLILLDGAHNPAGGRALGSYLEGVDSERRGKHWIIVGILKDKNIGEILNPLLFWADEIVLTRPDIPRGADPSAILEYLKDATARRTVQPTVPDAISYVEARLGRRDTVVITGSLYTVGEAKAFFAGVTPSLIRG